MNIHSPSLAELAQERWDALVIGAGPAGAMTALLSARRGIRTLLVEKAGFPRDKVCGCCLAPRGAEILREAGLDDPLGLSRQTPIASLAIRRGSQRARCALPGYRMVSRGVLDSAILKAAMEAGATASTMTEARVCGASRTVTLTRGDERVTASARAVVIADGLGGSAGRDIDALSWKVRRSSHVGLGAMLDGAPGGVEPGAITMCVGRGGYVGLAPLPCGRWVMGGALSPAFIRERGPSGATGEIIESCGVDGARLPSATLRGTPPLSRVRTAVEADGWIFCAGDASGYIEPFTGEGMTWALQSARMLTPILQRNLDGADTAGDWTRAIKRRLRPSKLGCRILSAGLRLPALTSCALAVGSRSRRLADLGARLLLAGSSARSVVA